MEEIKLTCDLFEICIGCLKQDLYTVERCNCSLGLKGKDSQHMNTCRMNTADGGTYDTACDATR